VTGSYRRIATEEAFSVPEVYQATQDWAATAAPDEPDQDFWRFVLTQDTETGLHAIRLICSGVFDRFPDLVIVPGHLGERIPFWPPTRHPRREDDHLPHPDARPPCEL
jgi:predicted TIM-barrel fold metal-dependent hydrolase